MLERPEDRNRRILVIDDNRAIHDDFRKILCPEERPAEAELDATEAAVFGPPAERVRPIAFQVDSAYQGRDGAALVEAGLARGAPYAMAFVDVRMPPGWDGVETTRKLWELDPDLQVVLCTAYSDYSWGEMFAALGHPDGLLILKKPFDAVEALQLAHALTEKWELHRQSKREREELERVVASRTSELRETNAALARELIEREAAAEAIRESEERFSSAFEHAPIGVALVSPDGRWLKVNRALCALVGYSTEELLARTFQEITYAEDLERDLENARRLIAGEIRTYQIEKRYIHRRGHLVTVLLDVSLVRDAAGRPQYFVSQIQDITERKRLETQVFQSQKMETVGKLAGGIAHEFNSILTAVIGRSDLLLDLLPADSPMARNAGEIRRAADRAAALTRQLLAYGRKQFLQPETLDLNRVLAGMDDVLRHLMGGDVVVRIAPAADLHAVRADAGQIEQVIMNMAINARDAMPEGGSLTLETANVAIESESVLRHPELKPGRYAVLSVADTGAGMSEDVMAHAFEPFFTTKGVGEGAGLGLSTCYGIVKQSGGHIAVASEPGHGTTFRIYLPEAPRPAAAAVPGLETAGAPGGGESILLVMADPALRELSSDLLRGLGYSVTPAASGVEALLLHERSARGRLDLLIADAAMSRMGGVELSERLLASHPRARILLIHPPSDVPPAPKGASAARVALLPSPFTPSALASKVREVLDEAAGSLPARAGEVSGSGR